MKQKRIAIIISVLVIFIVLSLLRTGNNIAKLYTEERTWFFLTDYEKRVKLFGNLYVLINKLERTIPKNETVLLISDDKRAHYLSRYYLYPRKIVDISVTDLETIERDKFKIVAIYFNNKRLIGAIPKSLPHTYRSLYTENNETVQMILIK